MVAWTSHQPSKYVSMVDLYFMTDGFIGFHHENESHHNPPHHPLFAPTKATTPSPDKYTIIVANNIVSVL
jgi:hypothetical protein